MAEKQMIDILRSSYNSSVELLRARLKSGLGRVYADTVINRIKNQAFYTTQQNIRVIVGRQELAEIIDTVDFAWESRLDRAKFVTLVAQLDIALLIISEEIQNEAKKMGWELCSLSENPFSAMVSSEKSAPPKFISFGVVVR